MTVSVLRVFVCDLSSFINLSIFSLVQLYKVKVVFSSFYSELNKQLSKSVVCRCTTTLDLISFIVVANLSNVKSLKRSITNFYVFFILLLLLDANFGYSVFTQSGLRKTQSDLLLTFDAIYQLIRGTVFSQTIFLLLID